MENITVKSRLANAVVNPGSKRGRSIKNSHRKNAPTIGIAKVLNNSVMSKPNFSISFFR